MQMSLPTKQAKGGCVNDANQGISTALDAEVIGALRILQEKQEVLGLLNEIKITPEVCN
jgi:hypothetical protein